MVFVLYNGWIHQVLPHHTDRGWPPVPLLMPWEQGCPNTGLISGQLALVFHELTKAEGVPSTSPLLTLKSSDILLLKFPHMPVGMKCDTLRQRTNWMWLKICKPTYLWNLLWEYFFPYYEIKQARHTSGGSFEWRISREVNLHYWRDLNYHLYANGGVKDGIEGGLLEDFHIRCTKHKGRRKHKWAGVWPLCHAESCSLCVSMCVFACIHVWSLTCIKWKLGHYVVQVDLSCWLDFDYL